LGRDLYSAYTELLACTHTHTHVGRLDIEAEVFVPRLVRAAGMRTPHTHTCGAR
jgi:hypothetical protein